MVAHLREQVNFPYFPLTLKKYSVLKMVEVPAPAFTCATASNIPCNRFRIFIYIFMFLAVGFCVGVKDMGKIDRQFDKNHKFGRKLLSRMCSSLAVLYVNFGMYTYLYA